MVTRISVGELKRVIKESQNEFKPIYFGHDESKKINDKAYSDIKKETDKYDGGLTNKSKKIGGGIGATDNKGMHDLTYDNINKPFIDKAKSQMKGYPSKDAEDRHKKDEFGNAIYDNDGKIYDAAKDHAKAAKQGKDTASEIGLTGRQLKKSDIEDLDKTMYENKRIKRLTFHTKFLSEGHMISKIPDELKVEGNKFLMRDTADNEYLVEWKSNKPEVTKKLNMTLVNEQKERIRQLWGYKSPETNVTTSSFRLKEGNELTDMVNKARKLIK